MAMVEPVPAFSDNYIWLLRDGDTAHVVDPGDAQPVLAALEEQGLRLASILVTHHHFDHVGGVAELKRTSGCQVYGPHNPALDMIDTRLADGDTVELGSYRFEVIEVPGHTLDHIAYYQEARDAQAPLLFCGDTLFAGGCGRLFEGKPAQMLESLQRLASLPPATRVYCAHEYTLANLDFARAADPDNTALAARCREAEALREAQEPTVPSTIELECATNPFLRSATPALREGLRAAGRDSGDSPVASFAALRAWKDTF